jgi:phosphonate transport system ATP-binding protein
MHDAAGTEAHSAAPAASPTAAAFALHGAGRRHGPVIALDGVTLAASPGERIALVGPSGAGKTTLLHLLGATLLPTGGRVEVLGEDPARLGPRALRRLRARIGTVYQGLHLVPQASVAENVLMGRLGRRSLLAVAAGAFRRADREEVARVLAAVGLLPRIDERVDRLSGGEQQRVAVARVLHQAPDLLLADEPFASVDPERAQSALALLLDAARGRTLVLSTHQLEPVLPHFPRLVGVRGGRLLFDRRREDVTPEDLAELYRPEGATRAPAPRRALAGPAPAHAELRVGASTAPGEHLLPRVVAELARARPALRVRLAVESTAEVLSRLAGGKLDLAFVGSRGPLDGVHFEDFADDEILLVAAPALLRDLPDRPLSPSAVSHLRRVDREPGSATRQLAEQHLAALGAPLDPATRGLEAGSLAAFKGALTAGAGVGFASRLSVAEELAAGTLVPLGIAAVRIPRRYFVAWREASPPDAAGRALVEASRRAARRSP